MKKIFKKRHKSRKLIIQALYNFEISKNNINEIENYLLDTINEKKIDKNYFHTLIKKIPEKTDILDKIIIRYTEKNTYMNTIEIAIIRLATFELLFCLKIPYKAIINEALELSKIFCSKSSYTFLNKILDGIAKEIREV
ncbi:MAG TPA: transcription antitermination factor NusB [Candidatus Azoamicus sp. OHIO1]